MKQNIVLQLRVEESLRYLNVLCT